MANKGKKGRAEKVIKLEQLKQINFHAAGFPDLPANLDFTPGQSGQVQLRQ